MKVNITDTRENTLQLQDLRPGDCFYVADCEKPLLYLEDVKDDSNRIRVFALTDLYILSIDANTTVYTYKDVKIDFTL